MITSVLNSVRDAASYAGTTTVTFAKDTVKYCDKTFVDLTEKVLPATAAKIVQKVVYGAPFAVAYYMLPAYINLTALAAYAMVHIIYDIAGTSDLPFSHKAYESLFTGLSMTHLAKALLEVVNLATQQKASLVAIGVNLVMASLFISKATQTPAPTFGSSNKTPVPTVEDDVVQTSTPTTAPVVLTTTTATVAAK